MSLFSPDPTNASATTAVTLKSAWVAMEEPRRPVKWRTTTQDDPGRPYAESEQEPSDAGIVRDVGGAEDNGSDGDCNSRPKRSTS